MSSILLLIMTQVAATPSSPSESMEKFETQPGFRVELVAAEPLVSDPISVAFGADGQLWVVEMPDYPSSAESDAGPQGRIRILKDVDQDGKFDTAITFLDRLEYANSVFPWRDGAIVCAAPDIFFARDTDGDGRADERRVLYTGFIDGNPQHRINGLKYGLDHWLYCANGDMGGQIKSLSTSKELDLYWNDLKIQPDSGDMQPLSGRSQFSRCRDDWANGFGGNNSSPIWHFVLAERYLRRNPLTVFPRQTNDLMDMSQLIPVYPISQLQPRLNEPRSVNRFTSSCGNSVYRDQLFGAKYSGAYFVCEPAYNLVHCSLMKPSGISFSNHPSPGPDKTEFLASSDNWFRPVQSKTGPDGAVWIVDMYRKVIEHPDYISIEKRKKVDFTAGRGMGRIYRVVKTELPETNRLMIALPDLDTKDLVKVLNHTNGVQRDLAQQLLIHRQDPEAIGLLVNLAVNGKSATARLHALCALDSLDEASILTIQKCLSDPHGAIRRRAIQIAESRLASEPSLQQFIPVLVNDADATVRQQLAYSLGEWPSTRSDMLLAELLFQNASDPWLTSAIMSSAMNRSSEIALCLLDKKTLRLVDGTHLAELLAILSQQENDQKTAKLLSAILKHRGRDLHSNTPDESTLSDLAGDHVSLFSDWQFEAINGWLAKTRRRGKTLTQLRDQADLELQESIELLQPMFREARSIVVKEPYDVQKCERALRLLGYDLTNPQELKPILTRHLTPRTNSEIRRAAIESLAKVGGPDVANLLLEHWGQLTPDLQRLALSKLLSRFDWTRSLLDEIESGRVAVGALSQADREGLLQNRFPDIRAKALTLLGGPTTTDRDKAIAAMTSSLTLLGDKRRGEQLFKKSCARCHELQHNQSRRGPELSELHDRSKKDWLIDILDPNRTVAPRYTTIAIESTSGKSYSGVLAGETANSITLVDSKGEEQMINRNEIEQVQNLGLSLMPTGLESEIPTPQHMADLIEYLQHP